MKVKNWDSSHYIMIINTLYVITIGIIIQNVVQIVNKLSFTIHNGQKEIMVSTVNNDLDVLLTFNANNIHLIALLFVMVLFKWVLFNSYQETKIMKTRIIYIVDAFQILLFLFAFFACIKGGTISIIAFAIYLLFRSIFDLYYAIKFKSFTNQSIEHTSLRSETRLEAIYESNKIFFNEDFNKTSFVKLLNDYIAPNSKKIIKYELEKMIDRVVLINILSVILSFLGAIVILSYGYILGWEIFSKVQQIELTQEMQIPILLVSYFVISSLGFAYIYTVKLHFQFTNLTKDVL